MDQADWRRLRPVLENLLRLPPEERLAELDYLDASDAGLARELLELLSQDGDGCAALEPPTGEALPWLQERRGEGAGDP